MRPLRRRQEELLGLRTAIWLLTRRPPKLACCTWPRMALHCVQGLVRDPCVRCMRPRRCDMQVAAEVM